AVELRERYDVRAEVLRADLVDRGDLAAVEARLLDVGDAIDLLVNNAGLGTYGPFTDADIDVEVAEIELNVVALVRLTHAALVAMRPRARGAIVNVSSLAGFQPAPSSATYAATKAFVNSFTHSVHEEARRAGVHVMAVCPGYTHTEFHERAGLGPSQLPEFLWQSAEEVVEVALRDLDRRRSVSIPGGINKVVGAASSITPALISRRVAGLVVRRT
ncbi:MAG TPA: SDR family NAD(P)-dependent oxidoreductase, partial [Acidimicrobiia bacterium]|nr:SDR family NAD(P)-dependent oxidoreductase [Acidimicrobiia bacterium]